MTVTAREYNSDLLKGTGLIQETLLLLDIYNTGIAKKDFIEEVIQSNVLVKGHDNRIKDIIEHVFYRRYVNCGDHVVPALKKLLQKHIGLDAMRQLLMIYTCRKNLILFDFITTVYQKTVKENVEELPQDAVKSFIEESIRNQAIPKPWADSTKRKVAEHIHACLIDFKLIDRQKKLLPLFLNDLVANYLAHEMHFLGFSEESILSADEWKLFGYDRYDTLKHLERISFQGHYILQSSGELVRITWEYKNMNEFIDGIG